MNRTLALVLAGGVGSRLGPLAHARAKPAVPFGGNYRLIDFTLSNAANSGVNRIGVLVQYKPLSLVEHIGSGESWGFGSSARRLQILPPRPGLNGSARYRGTADAVRKNLDFVRQGRYDMALILSGDHIYNMSYKNMVEFHRAKGADVTVAVTRVPIEDAHHFGIAGIDREKRIIDWQEKPLKPRGNLASMGVYVFSRTFLVEALEKISGDDFAKDIIPYARKNAQTYAFQFSGYWRDVGTLEAYWRSNLDLLNPASGLDPERWKTYTNGDKQHRVHGFPNTPTNGCTHIHNSKISRNCVIEGQVENSIVSPDVWIRKDAVVRNSIIMSGCVIGESAKIEKAILDEQVVVGKNAVIGFAESFSPGYTAPYCQEEGLVAIGKNVFIPDGRESGRTRAIGPVISERFFPRDNVRAPRPFGKMPGQRVLAPV